MDISIFGLGYVGTVSSACFAKQGHHVIGVDPVPVKVELINNGETPIIEKDIGQLIKQAKETGRLEATNDSDHAVAHSSVSFICVGTPSQDNGNLSLTYVQRVCEDIGKALAKKEQWHLVVVRSTVLPGSMHKVVLPVLEAASGKKAGRDFGVCHNPEFLREGSAVHDFFNPPKTVIGQMDQSGGDTLASLYHGIDAPLIRTTFEISEMVKYVDNIWHGLKVGFSNEIGNFCKSMQIDSHKVMDIFCQDTKLNISPSYLRPGFAFGGSCLPKDIRALNYAAKSLDLELPIIKSILPSNAFQIDKALKMIMMLNQKNIGVLGFSFKAGTDDLRESPMVELIERLIGKGYNLKVYDRNVRLARLVGANKDYILNRIPHISKLMVDSVADIIDHADTIVIGNSDDEFSRDLKTPGKNIHIVDLVRIKDIEVQQGGYDGICW
jgi:GDP-mannose 6-dehydrogenase